MAETKVFRVEIAYSGRFELEMEAESAEQALIQAHELQLTAEQLEQGLEKIEIDPWDLLSED